MTTIEVCGDCKTGKMQRDYVTNEMVVWTCSSDGCNRTEFENFADMDDAGWDWLRQYYTEEKR